MPNVYDDKNNYAPRHKRTADSGEGQGSDSGGNDTQSKAASTEELRGSESGRSQGDRKSDNATKDEADKVGKGYKHDDDKSSKGNGRFRGFFTRRRTSVGLATMTIIGGGGFGMFGMLSGPLELITIANALLKPAGITEKATDARTKGFLKWYRFQQTGDIGETRVTILGSKRFGAARQQLADVGITFERNPNTGRPYRVNIDGSKIPDHLKGSSPAETRANLARHYKLPIHQISGVGDGKFVINERGMNAKQARLLASSSLAVLDGGKIQTALNKRALAKFWNAPALFHPMQRAAGNLQEKWDNRPAKLAREKERKSQDSRRQKLATQYTNTKEALARRLGPVSGLLSSTLTLTGALCIVKETADLLPRVNYEHTVSYAEAEAVDKQAVGSQLQTGDDFYMEQAGAVRESLYDDEGRGIWGPPMNALTNDDLGTGEDIFAEHKQAFTLQGGSIKELIESFKESGNISNATEDDDPSTIDRIDAVAGVACTPIGYVVQGVASITLLAIGPGGWIVKTAQGAGSYAALAGVMHVINTLMEGRAEALAAEIVGGPQYGALLAYGARSAHNLNSRSMGGVALPQSEEIARFNEINELELQQFQEKSFFARIFDTHDTRSLVSRAVRTVPTKSTSNMATTVLNPAKSLSSSFSSIVSPRIYADEPYDWGFPIYSIPSQLLEDSRFEDPYENAERVASLLSGGVLAATTDDMADDSSSEGQVLSSHVQRYVTKAEVCFGVDIFEGPHGWEVVQQRPVMTFEEDYREADCDNFSDENWARMLMFVFDNAIVNTVDCFEGGAESCQRIHGTGSTNQQPGGSQSEIIDGFAFPLQTSKSGIGNAYIFSNGTTEIAGHPYTAYDISANVGTVVLSATAGRVTSVNQSSQPCGDSRTAMSVQVFDAENNRTYFYQHMAHGSNKVSRGQVIQPGQPLGTLGGGATHCNTVPHLHIDAVNGTTRPPCRRGSCSESAKSMFIDLGPSLYQTFQTLRD